MMQLILSCGHRSFRSTVPVAGAHHRDIARSATHDVTAHRLIARALQRLRSIGDGSAHRCMVERCTTMPLIFMTGAIRSLHRDAPP
jgi:hypothetical protein